MNEKESIEMTALLVGGTKNKGHSPTSMKVERETKRKASEPWTDVSCPEEEKSASAASEEEMTPNMQWIRGTMKEIKDRTDDISQIEHSMTAMSFEMEGLKTTVVKMSDAFSTIMDESQSRERFADLITKLDTDIRARDQKTNERITRKDKNMDAKIEEKSAPK